ncbi:hypothetical protein BGZ99_007916, partial [Dissophora globulifera]
MWKQGYAGFMSNISNNASASTAIDTTFEQDVANTDEITASDLSLRGVSKIYSTHMKLLTLLENTLDGPLVSANAMKKCKYDTTFLSYFRNTPLITEALLRSGWTALLT